MATESSSFHWPHDADAAVCLSYDDGMPCHVDLVAPMLEEFGFRGTFYTPIHSDIIARPDAWRDLARRGHEIGNHTIFHPCRRPIPEPPQAQARAWNNLSRFDEPRLRNELTVSNFALHLLDGRTERTYGNTCHNVTIGPEQNATRIEPILADFFVAGRGECTNRPSDPHVLDLMNIGTSGGDGGGMDKWRPLVEAAMAQGGLMLMTFHGVGPNLQQLFVQESEQRAFCSWLRELGDRVWVAPVREAARWIAGHRG